VIGNAPRLKRFAVALLLFFAFPGAWMIHRLSQANISICFFRTITGRPGPFGGLTRALAHAVRGQLSTAFAFHPFWWLAGLAAVGLGSVYFFDAAKGTNHSARITRVWQVHTRYCILVLIAIAVLSLVWHQFVPIPATD